MKVLKKLATLSMAALMAFGVSAFVACNGGNGSESTASEAQKTYTCYEFVVVNADGTKVGEGYQVQVCIVDENGEVGACLRPMPVENGVCVYNIANITAPGVYEAHVLYTNEEGDNTSVALQETVRTSADAFGEYTLTLAE